MSPSPERGVDDSPSRAPPSAERIRPLTSFVAPRYWGTWLFVGWLRLAAALPWRRSIAIHRAIGRALFARLRRQRRIVERNIEVCFPRLTPPEVETLARQHFESYGAAMAEIAFAWFRPASALPPVVVQGAHHVEAARREGRGIILYSGHFTPLELAVNLAKQVVPDISFMYRARNNALLDAIQRRARLRVNDVSFANDNVRGMVRALQRGGVIWYAPDQAHGGKGAELLPFFGEAAMTSTATARLARLSGAAIVPFFFCRADDGAGYVLRFERALEDVPSGDDRADTLILIQILERFIMECPAQYLWTHRRFRGRGSDVQDAYAHDPDA